jgi:hypothetical protein
MKAPWEVASDFFNAFIDMLANSRNLIIRLNNPHPMRCNLLAMLTLLHFNKKSAFELPSSEKFPSLFNLSTCNLFHSNCVIAIHFDCRENFCMLHKLSLAQLSKNFSLITSAYSYLEMNFMHNATRSPPLPKTSIVIWRINRFRFLR